MVVNRPEKRNVLNRATRLEMVHAMDDVRTDESVRVLVLSGSGGKSFIAGSDLTELAGLSALQMEAFMASLAQRFYTRFEQLDKPVIAMIDGLCLGGGLELAMACDVRIASDASRFGQPEILLGIMPGGGGTQRLPRLVGVGKAKEMIFTGSLVDAEEALRIGLINKICQRDELESVVMGMAGQMAQQSPLVLKWAKRAVNISQEAGLNLGLDYEALAECLLFTSQDREEGIRAFLEKRPPIFKGM
ncbi:MAG: crotonase [Desulfobacteraceae bacterium]|nr:MAG: crotonase [Desulfobacteraceae bacterium]